MSEVQNDQSANIISTITESLSINEELNNDGVIQASDLDTQIMTKLNLEEKAISENQQKTFCKFCHLYPNIANPFKERFLK